VRTGSKDIQAVDGNVFGFWKNASQFQRIVKYIFFLRRVAKKA
jgi:hypothetical protein